MVSLLTDRAIKLSKQNMLKNQPTHNHFMVTRVQHISSSATPIHPTTTRVPHYQQYSRDISQNTHVYPSQKIVEPQAYSGVVRCQQSYYPNDPSPVYYHTDILPLQQHFHGHQYAHTFYQPTTKIPCQEINGCYYFPPLQDRGQPIVQYGYPQRGKQRKTQKLSSRFATQAGKFHHHANFYVKNCAESVLVHNMGDNYC